MALATIDFYIKPTDGWVQVADDPTSLLIRPGFDLPWWVAITASGSPVATAASASIALTFTNQPNSGQTVTLGGRVYTVLTAFDPEDPEADAFLLGGNAEGTIENLVEVVNGRAEIPAVAATGTITISGGAPSPDDTVTVGDDTYVFKAAAAGPFEVTIGTAAVTATNLIGVINAQGTSGVTANTGGSGVVDLAADVAGFDGNAIVLDEDADNTVVTGAGTLEDGANAVAAVAPNALVYATKTTSAVATFTAITEGVGGNSIAVAENLSNATFAGGATALAGGVSPVVGVMMGHARDRAREAFQTGAITGEVYVRIAETAQVPVQFGVIRDQS